MAVLFDPQGQEETETFRMRIKRRLKNLSLTERRNNAGKKEKSG
jgi:hypothetical protein